MEENRVESKKKSKIALILISIFLVACVATIFCTLFYRKPDSVVEMPDDGSKIRKEVTASNEKELRELLLQDTELAITVLEDIIVEETIPVNGTKKLLGKKSIVMKIGVESYQNIFTVKKDSTLILNGVKVDGNGSASGVKVETDAALTILSGEIASGCPHGVDSSGTVWMKGGSINGTLHTGMYIRSLGTAYIEGGNIRDTVYCAAKVSENAYMSITKNAILQNSKGMLVDNSGTCDITGGALRGAGSYMAQTSGIMNIRYEGDEPDGRLEWSDCSGYSALITKDTGVLNVNGLYLHDMDLRAITSRHGTCEVNVENCLIENTGHNGIVLRSDTTKLKNVEIKNAGIHGIHIQGNITADIEDVTITNPVERGIYNIDSTLTGKNVVITKPGTYGVSTAGSDQNIKGNVSITGLTVKDAQGVSALNSVRSMLSAKDVKIINAKEVGVRAHERATISLQNVEITKAGKHGVYAMQQGIIVLKKATITEPGKHGVLIEHDGSKIDVNTLTINKPGERGIYNIDGTVTGKNIVITEPKAYGIAAAGSKDIKGTVTLNGLTISKAQGVSAINCIRSTFSATNVTITDANEVGARAHEGGTITLKNANITKAGKYGVYAMDKGNIILKQSEIREPGKQGVLVEKVGSTAKLDTVKIIQPGERGVYNIAGTITGKNITVTKPGAYGVATGGLEKEVAGNVIISNLTVTCDNKANAINAVRSTMKVTGAKLENAKEFAARAHESGTLTLEDATITNAGKYGAIVFESGTVNLKKVDITKPGEHGVYVSDASSKATVDTVTVNECVQRGLYVVAGVLEGKDVIVNNAGTYGVSAAMNPETKAGAKVTLDGVVINDAGSENASINSQGSVMDIRNATVKGAAKVGIRATDAGALKLSDVTINASGTHGVLVGDKSSSAIINTLVVNNSGEHGVQNYGTMEANDISIVDCGQRGIHNVAGTLTGTNVTITNPGTYAVAGSMNNANEGGTITISNLTATGAQGDIAVNSQKTKLTLIDSEINNAKKIAIRATDAGALTLTGVSINNAGQHGVFIGDVSSSATIEDLTVTSSTNDGIQNKGTLNVNDVTIIGCGERGIRNIGGTVIGEGVTVTTPGTYGVSSSPESGRAGSVTLTDLTVTNAGHDRSVSTNGSILTLTDVNIVGAKKYGIGLDNAASKLYLTNAQVTTIADPKSIAYGVAVWGCYAEVDNLTVEAGMNKYFNNGWGTIVE